MSVNPGFGGQKFIESSVKKIKEAKKLINNNVNGNHVRQIINLTMTTSPSYILMSSLDIARSELAINGKEIFKKCLWIF